MIILGAGLLTWYYTSALSRQLQARRAAQRATSNRAQGEMSLPPLGPIDPPRTSTVAVDAEHTQPAAAAPVVDQASQLPLTPGAATLPPPTGPLGLPPAYGFSGPQYNNAPPKTEAQLLQERLLSGATFVRGAAPGGITSTNPTISGDALLPGAQSGLAPSAGPAPPTAARTDSDLTTLLRPTTISSAHPELLPTQRFLLAKGAFIDCTLETAIDSTLPGMTTCITASDTFGADGKVVLLERGTKLIGETRGQVQQGTTRVFVLWTEARTPTGIVVPLDSPGTDELGRAGLSGQVDRHFWQRFGAAILISTLDGAVQAAVQSTARGGGTVIYSPSSSEAVLTDVLKSTVNIAPTVTKRNGERIQVFVARDVDFSSVYELRNAPAR
jgi:type IV secretion system protein VirB10